MIRNILMVMLLLLIGAGMTACIPYNTHDRGYHKGQDRDHHYDDRDGNKHKRDDNRREWREYDD